MNNDVEYISPKNYIKNMPIQQKCRWMAFLKALTIIDNKAISLGRDPNTIDLPNKQIYKSYIQPESETIEYYLGVVDTDKDKEFFLY